jgi:thiol-disulfide isomerase/thioredoxin
MMRRHWLMAGAGVAAAAIGVAWRQRHEDTPAGSAPAEVSGGEPALGESFWQLEFPAPTGPAVKLSALRGKPLLVNFWGTWCPPCVKEMPELDQFARRFAPQGWRVLGLAVDNEKAVREFLARSPVSYTIGLAGFEGSELARTLGNDQSGLPFTVAIDGRGVVRHRKAGATTLDELARWTQGI